MTQTSARLLKLLSLLQAQRDWPGEELARRLEVSGRTVRRDIDRLRGLGYPVDAITGPAGGYRLHAGAAMPPLLLEDDEAVAIAVGLRTAAGAAITGIEDTALRALVKLEQVLPAHLRTRVSALQAITAVASEGGPTVDPAVLTVIAGACRDRERLRFAYRRRDGAETDRLVEPHSLVHLSRRWYLLAWDGERGDWRIFRLDRLSEPVPTRTRFAPREPPAPDPAGYVATHLSSAPYRYQARVVLHAAVEQVAARSLERWGTLEPLGDGSLRVPHGGRLARLAGDADRDARRRLRGARAARAGRPLPRAGGPLRARRGVRARRISSPQSDDPRLRGGRQGARRPRRRRRVRPDGQRQPGRDQRPARGRRRRPPRPPRGRGDLHGRRLRARVRAAPRLQRPPGSGTDQRDDGPHRGGQEPHAADPARRRHARRGAELELPHRPGRARAVGRRGPRAGPLGGDGDRRRRPRRPAGHRGASCRGAHAAARRRGARGRRRRGAAGRRAGAARAVAGRGRRSSRSRTCSSMPSGRR